MAEFLLIYQGGDPSWRENRSEAEIQKAMMAWGEWFRQLESTGNLRSPGSPLAPGGVLLKKNGNTIQTDTAMAEVKELIGGYSIIVADTLEQAAELAKGTPFLVNNPNGRVHVRSILQIG